ncbi:MAG: aminopeptidase P N-terminal domain-containing protein [Terracidiphilus sp.]|jgi:Xaa-Pro aminopeptidase
MKKFCFLGLAFLALGPGFPLLNVSLLHALDKQPAGVFHARRVALAGKLQGGVAILFAAEEPELDFMPYRQDSNFYYLTGWDEPGAALLIEGDAPQAATPHAYKEILFLPARNLRMEAYTGVKMDAATPGVAEAAGVDRVEPMTELPAELSQGISVNRALFANIWTQPDSASATALLSFTATTLGTASAPPAHDVTTLTMPLRQIKDDGEITLIKEASKASILAQRVMMQWWVKPGMTERAIAGAMTAVWMENGCERPSYAPIVGSGINSTTLHYSINDRTMQDGDLLLVDAACEYSMYAADITRTVPVNGHYTPRQREIYLVVLGAQQAAIDAFVAGKSTINDRDRKDPNSLDTVAYNYINTHGKDLHGQSLGKYWLHGLGHMMGIDVHDPGNYPVVLKPGMVFTIEPGVYIPEEKIGVRIECDFLVTADGKLVDLDASLPHTPDEIEAAMQAGKGAPK